MGSDDLIDIKELQALAAATSNIVMTSHANAQCTERLIDSSDILEALLHGEIIEDYPNDYPFPSCLLLSFSKSGKPTHVCCGIGDGKIYIITAYYPTTEKWEDDMKTRKAVKK